MVESRATSLKGRRALPESSQSSNGSCDDLLERAADDLRARLRACGYGSNVMITITATAGAVELVVTQG